MKNTLTYILILISLNVSSAQGLKRLDKMGVVRPKEFKTDLDVKFKNNQFTINNVKIEGSNKKYKFILDTGSDLTIISHKVANEIGFIPLAVDSSTDGYVTKKHQVGLINVKLNGINFINIATAKFDLAALNKILCEIDGIIGYSLMKKCVWNLNDQGVSISNKAKYFDIYLESKREKLSNDISVIAGFTNGLRSTMLLDLGDNGTIQIQDRWIEYIKEKEIRTGNGKLFTTVFDSENIKNLQHKILKAPELSFGDSKLSNIIVYVADSPDYPINSIGAGILNYYNLILDLPQKKFYYKQLRNEYLDPGYLTFGFKYQIDGKNRPYISFLWNSSPAKDVGIVLNQYILKINDLELQRFTEEKSCEIRELIDREMEKKDITIVLRRKDGSEITHTLTKQNLFN